MISTEFISRRRLVTADLARRRLDLFLISNLVNVRYLTGFTGSNALLLLSPDGAVLYTDGRYRIQATEETECTVKVVQGSLIPRVAKSLPRGRLGFEAAHLTFDAYRTLKAHLPSKVAAMPVDGLVEEYRMVKSEAEIETMRRSAALACNAFEQTLQHVRPGIRELDLAAELDYRMRRLGAESPAFETIVASGERSALPHASPTAKVLGNQEILLIDMGAFLEGYASDMTRTIFLGAARPKAKRFHHAVLEAQQAALEAVREGTAAKSVDRAARRVLRTAGLERAFVHSTGHGLGLEIHESPRVARKVELQLKAGMAITVEPGVYLQGFGGIRIEDMVVVNRGGCEILTPASKELIEL
ncbi:MAG TPA: aminopeptidase P family protein [Bryobacteraceae bacterium]|nr:aminopeptidase P family protein [Bryobacteraceae bacterium]